MMSDVSAELWLALAPWVPWLVALLVVLAVLRSPLPGRSPSGDRDPWRAFKYGVRREVMDRAGGRCEAATFILWVRCTQAATDADHIYPWSKGGPTVVSNGQALCRSHNTSKGSFTPAWWYVLGLERRRATYVAVVSDRRVSAHMSEADRALRLQRR